MRLRKWIQLRVLRLPVEALWDDDVLVRCFLGKRHAVLNWWRA